MTGDLNDLEREFLNASQVQLDAGSAKGAYPAEREEVQSVRWQMPKHWPKTGTRQSSRGSGVCSSAIGLLIALAVALAALVLAGIFFWQAQERAAEAQCQAGLAVDAKATADANAAEAVSAKATAQANLGLAQQKLDELKVEELLAGARDKKIKLDVNGAIADFNAAAAAARSRDKVLDVSGEISDTLRYVATTYVQEGENILCETLYDQPEQCAVPVTGQAGEPMTTSVVISQTYLAWAQAVAPQIVGWSSYTSTVQQEAVISATALYSQALALHPPSTHRSTFGLHRARSRWAARLSSARKQVSATARPSEQPPHTVKLDGYWLQRTEVTNEQYERCVVAGACQPPDNSFWDKPRSARLPVTYVDWNQASAYAAWVGGRLPTEAEWEYACRGGDGRIYPWGDEPPATERLNYNYEIGGTTEVGTYPPGANDLYDMAGNVYEWTADWYSEDYYKNSPERNPVGPDEGVSRTLRGGAWVYFDYYVRCAHRNPPDPDTQGRRCWVPVCVPRLLDSMISGISSL